MGGIILPTGVAAASQWRIDDWTEPRGTSSPATGGLATVEFPALSSDEQWLIDHMVCSCSSSTDTVLRLYIDHPDPARLRDGTDRGNFDVADWPSGLLVRPSTSLVAQWEGASDGAVGTITLQARRMLRS